MTFIQYIYIIILLIVLVIYRKLCHNIHILIDLHNNVHYYQDHANYLEHHISQRYNIHDYDSNIGYDLEIENDIVSIHCNSS
jgi:hypothetical protein